MTNIDISDKPYKPYLTLECDDSYKTEIIQALDFLWDNPLAKEKIVQAGTRTDEPLEIVYDKKQITLGYGLLKGLDADTDFEQYEANKTVADERIDHRIVLNPAILESFQYETEEGYRQQASLERILAHELFHAADKNTNYAEINAFTLRYQWKTILAQLDSSTQGIEIMRENLGDKFTKLTSEEQNALISTVFSSEDVIQKLNETMHINVAKMESIFTDDNSIASYISRIEKPAIEFANEIMKGIEPPRITTYADSINREQIQAAMSPEMLGGLATQIMQTIDEVGYDELLSQGRAALKTQADKVAPGALVREADIATMDKIIQKTSERAV